MPHKLPVFSFNKDTISFLTALLGSYFWQPHLGACSALWDTHRCSRASSPEKAFLATDLILFPNRVLQFPNMKGADKRERTRGREREGGAEKKQTQKEKKRGGMG